MHRQKSANVMAGFGRRFSRPHQNPELNDDGSLTCVNRAAQDFESVKTYFFCAEMIVNCVLQRFAIFSNFRRNAKVDDAFGSGHEVCGYPSKVSDTIKVRVRRDSIGREKIVSSSMSRFGMPTLSFSSIPSLKYGRKKSKPPPTSAE